MNKFHFELVSPSEKLVSEDVTMVTVPGEEGDFGVLSGHAPLISSVRMGVLNIHPNAMNDNPRRIFIAGGFADVGPDRCTVLAEEATDMSLIDVTALDEEIRDLRAKVDVTVESFEKARAFRKLAIAEAKRAAI